MSVLWGVFLGYLNLTCLINKERLAFLEYLERNPVFCFWCVWVFFLQIGSCVSLTGLELFNITQQGLEFSILLPPPPSG